MSKAPSLIIRKEPNDIYFVTEIIKDVSPVVTLELLRKEINSFPDVKDLQRYSHIQLLKFKHVFNQRVTPEGMGLNVQLNNSKLLDIFLESEVVRETYQNMYIYEADTSEWNVYDIINQEPLNKRFFGVYIIHIFDYSIKDKNYERSNCCPINPII